MPRPQKITFGEMRSTGTRGLVVFCSDYRCSHNVTLAPAVVDRWPDELRLSDLEPRFVCIVCGRRPRTEAHDDERAQTGVRLNYFLLSTRIATSPKQCAIVGRCFGIPQTCRCVVVSWARWGARYGA